VYPDIPLGLVEPFLRWLKEHDVSLVILRRNTLDAVVSLAESRLAYVLHAFPLHR
jgi:hypothetical protein